MINSLVIEKKISYIEFSGSNDQSDNK